MRKLLPVFLCFLALVVSASAQVSFDRLLKAKQEPGNWLTYSGSYDGQRHSGLRQITRENVHRLKLKWVFQMRTFEKVETTPLVVDGIMYLTYPPSDVYAVDTRTGRTYWSYLRDLPEPINTCCGNVNRGLAILGERLYLGTVDAHLVALDAKTGSVIWDVKVADHRAGYAITAAPLVVKDKVITGIAGGEFGIRGFLDAYDAESGRRAWRFYTVPGPGEAGNQTWEGDSWKTGGAPTWLTGSYDPELDLLYWGTGNPAPDFNGEVRKGDNLYADSVVALDADSGKLSWHFQFTPHDVWDWDSVQIPVLVDTEFQNRQRKLMLWPNRNGFYYVLDRRTGEYLLGKAFVKQTWAEGLDSSGRPIVKPGTAPSEEGTLVSPAVTGAINWHSTSYSPRTGLLYLPVREWSNLFYMGEAEYIPGTRFYGSLYQPPGDDPGSSAIRAMVPQTGEVRWEYKLHGGVSTGLLSTAGDLLFGGTDEGQVFALDTVTGQELWRLNTGGTVIAAPISYLSEGKQLVSIAAGTALFTFELGE